MTVKRSGHALMNRLKVEEISYCEKANPLDHTEFGLELRHLGLSLIENTDYLVVVLLLDVGAQDLSHWHGHRTYGWILPFCWFDRVVLLVATQVLFDLLPPLFEILKLILEVSNVVRLDIGALFALRPRSQDVFVEPTKGVVGVHNEALP